MSDDRLTLSIPKFSGYKTLVINVLMLIIGVLTFVFPGAVLPSSDQLGVAYDALAAFWAAAVPIVNIVLRLMTAGPVAPPVNVLGTKPKSGPGSSNPPSGEGWPESDFHRSDETKFRADEEEMLEKRYAAAYQRGLIDGRRQGYYSAMRVDQPPLRDAPADKPIDAQFETLASKLDEALTANARVEEAAKKAEAEARERAFKRQAGACVGRSNLTIVPLDEDGEPLTLSEAEVVETTSPSVLGCGMQQARELLNGSAKATMSTVLAFLVAFLAPATVLGGVTFLAGCSTVREINSVAAAETIGQRAFALYSTFTTLEESAAVIVQDKRVPLEARRAVQTADKVAKPAADAMLAAYRALQTARKAQVDGSGTLDSVEAHTARLEAAMRALEPYVTTLTAKVATARGTA